MCASKASFELIWIRNKPSNLHFYLLYSHTLWSTFAGQGVDIKGRNSHIPSRATDLNTHLKNLSRKKPWLEFRFWTLHKVINIKCVSAQESCLGFEPPTSSHYNPRVLPQKSAGRSARRFKVAFFRLPLRTGQLRRKIPAGKNYTKIQLEPGPREDAK